MKVGIVSSISPFVNGGGRLIVDWTAAAMRERGHQVERILIPFSDHPDFLLAQMSGMRATPLRGFDRIITIRWPAHVVQHDNKVAWFIHHYRALFDLWDTPYRNVPDSGEGRGLRELIREADTRTLNECMKVYSNSQVVSDRLLRFNGIASTPLLPPLGDDISRFHYSATGDFILYPSRITSHKRQLLAVQAMQHTSTPVRLVLMGRSDSRDYSDQILREVEASGLADRVVVHDRWVDEAEKAAALSECLAVAYIPADEDSYGYPSLEAALSGKCVVTVADSGGALEFVVDGTSGLVCEPTAVGLAAAFDELYRNRAWAKELGRGASRRVDKLGISWDTVVESLLGDL